MKYPSWGFFPKVLFENVTKITRNPTGPLGSDSFVLPRGLGRSYGDVCLNDGHSLLLNDCFNRFISFDENTGLLHCESGVTLDEILKVFVPKGWFPKVTPGTKYVTVGGAIASDVHGKNHHKVGSFGNTIAAIRLLRSSGDIVDMNVSNNIELLRATIGGFGLTGFIVSASFYLQKIKSSTITQEQITFSSLNEFLELSKDSDSFDYSVAWVDCVNSKNVRGIFFRGNESNTDILVSHKDPKFRVPFFFPNWILNSFTIRLFNHFYYLKNWNKKSVSNVHYDKFFYPLDSISNWNKIYGSRGFFQYQFVVPSNAEGITALASIFTLIKTSKSGSFLAVLKSFGDFQPVGYLSFPMPGITLALDFPNEKGVSELFAKCDRLVESAGGRIYPAKDSHMGADTFKNMFEKLSDFKKQQDPHFSSSFSRRVKL